MFYLSTSPDFGRYFPEQFNPNSAIAVKRLHSQVLINNYLPAGAIPYEVPNKNPEDVMNSDFNRDSIFVVRPEAVSVVRPAVIFG